MKKIGITANFMYPDSKRAFFAPKTLSFVENEMFEFVSRKGVLPVLIPNVKSDLLIPILEELDGFIFQGGADLAPESYGEKPIGKWKGDLERDIYELKIMDYAVKSRKPILAICRGLQLMNVYFGGTLYQDIATQKPTAKLHRDAEKYDQLHHKISLRKGKLLAQLYPSDKDCYVNSIHHQGIKNLGSDLEILATSSDDGIVEAITYKKAPKGVILGLQWHPEFSNSLKGKILDGTIIYQHFIEKMVVD